MRVDDSAGDAGLLDIIQDADAFADHELLALVGLYQRDGAAGIERR